MDSKVTNTDKKHFLKWFTQNYELKRRESLWILDYLYSHDIMLEKTHFVQNVDQTSRGIYMTVKGNQKPAFRFYKNGHEFKDAMQAFHEIRLNWSASLYVEIDFEDAWEQPNYLAVIEDNPYFPWNENIPSEITDKMDDVLDYETLIIARDQLLNEIDKVLVNGEEASFKELSSELLAIEQKIENINVG